MNNDDQTQLMPWAGEFLLYNSINVVVVRFFSEYSKGLLCNTSVTDVNKINFISTELIT